MTRDPGTPRRRRRARFAGLLLALGALGVGVGVEAQAPLLTIEPDTTEIHVGDPLTLTISVEHASDLSVRWPDSLSLAPFEALALETGSATPSGDGLITSARLHVTAFELGELEIPSFDIELTDGVDVTMIVSTDPVVIGVTTVGLDEGGDIRDVKGPRAIARDWLLLWPWLLLALTLAGLAYWWGRRRSRRRDGADATTPAPLRPPHELALKALDRLEASPLLARGEVKAYHIEVSRIMRSYLEGRYRIRALEMITPDVISSLGYAGVHPDTRTSFRRFLDACDLVKFAKVQPGDAACRAVLADARTLVERTKSVPPPPEAASEETAGGAGGTTGGAEATAPDAEATTGDEVREVAEERAEAAIP